MFRRKETKRAFVQGVRDGKAKTYYGAHIRYKGKELKPSPVQAMSEEEKEWFPDVWEAMKAQVQTLNLEPEKDAPPRRQSQEVEAQVCRDFRLYRKCSRNCKPRAFGGCKGHMIFPSCPQLESED
jgi:hypothetical protein